MADNIKFFQLQPFSLAGSGASIGDTSIVISSMLDIESTTIAMSDFGTIGYGTLEPNTSGQEEQFSFTGLTNNANGTTTLSGVKTVLFKAPYTETSGLAKDHAGGVTLVISNTSGLYNKVAVKSNDETITETWTFTNPNVPRMDAQVTYGGGMEEYLATKRYVDSVAIAGAPDASTTTKGITKMSVAPASATSPIAVGDNDGRVPTQGENDALVGNNTTIAVGTGNKFVTQTGLQSSAEVYAADAGANDTYVITLSPVPTAYATGMTIRFKANTINTGAATINVNSLGAKTIVKNGATTLEDGDIKAGQIVTVCYDGTNFQLQGVSDKISAASATTLTNGSNANSLHYHSNVPYIGVSTYNMSGTTSNTFAHGLGATPAFVEVTVLFNNTTTITTSTGYFDGTNTKSAYAINIASPWTGTSSSDIARTGTGSSDYNTATCSFDSTNVTLTWSRSGTPSGTAQILIKVYKY